MSGKRWWVKTPVSNFDLPLLALFQRYGYRPGDDVVVMPAADADEMRITLQEWLDLYGRPGHQLTAETRALLGRLTEGEAARRTPGGGGT